MAPRPKQAPTSSASVLWHGEPPICLRIQASGILGRHLTDEQWYGLCRVIWAYSFEISMEVQREPFAAHKKAAADVLTASQSLIDAIERANTPEMGSIVSNHMAREWEAQYDHEAEYDRDRSRMEGDLQSLLEQHGVLTAEQEALDLVGTWQGFRMRSPSYPADFTVLLHEFREAARAYNIRLRNGDARHETAGMAWVAFIGLLTEWLASHGFPTGPSKSGINAGKITELAKAVNEIVPFLYDDNGKKRDRQMKRPTIDDASLADSIINAQAEYESLRPKARKQGG